MPLMSRPRNSGRSMATNSMALLPLSILPLFWSHLLAIAMVEGSFGPWGGKSSSQRSKDHARGAASVSKPTTSTLNPDAAVYTPLPGGLARQSAGLCFYHLSFGTLLRSVWVYFPGRETGIPGVPQCHYFQPPGSCNGPDIIGVFWLTPVLIMVFFLTGRYCYPLALTWLVLLELHSLLG